MINATDDGFLRTDDAAALLRVSKSKIEKDRLNGKGCKFYRMPHGRAILYRKADLLSFIEQGARLSTSEGN